MDTAIQPESIETEEFEWTRIFIETSPHISTSTGQTADLAGRSIVRDAPLAVAAELD
jgi:hypothetical protein